MKNEKSATADKLRIKNWKDFFILICFSFMLQSIPAFCQINKSDFPVLKGPYLGQKPPGMTPELFAPGIVSTNNTEWTLTFTPDGLECFSTIQGINNYNILITMKSVNGVWQKPERASFSMPDHNADPFFTPDGKRLFFWSNGPDDTRKQAGNNSDIYYVDRVGNGWGKPVRLDTAIINTTDWQIFPTVASNGNLYFSSHYPADTKGDFDVYMSEFKEGKYSKPVNLGDSVNSPYLEQEPYISPDESFIIFASNRHAPKTENWDLYICFKKKDGTWTKAKNMGNKINSPYQDMAPIGTSDGKYLFFSSNRRKPLNMADKNLTYRNIIDALNSPQNGSQDVYWVDAKVIEELKQKVNSQ